MYDRVDIEIATPSANCKPALLPAQSRVGFARGTTSNTSQAQTHLLLERVKTLSGQFFLSAKRKTKSVSRLPTQSFLAEKKRSVKILLHLTKSVDGF